MLISVNKEVANSDFEQLLNLTTDTLQETSTKETNRYLKLLGNKLEDEVYDVMCSCSVNTPFEGTIELISGQKFPDIIANNFYGVEVKSTKQNLWKTTGNSVLESTRVEDIQRIYMLFGKIFDPIEFKCRPYEDCLYDVIVTHSPRYAIDMNLSIGKTIFDKIDLEYDTIRQSPNPIKPFKEYYRNKLSEGQELWWLDNEEYKPDSIIFKIWNSLNKKEKDKFTILGYAYFPEILGKQQTKFDKFTLWLSVKQRIICPNVRDLFTAGGRGNITIENSKLSALPKALVKFINNIDLIVNEFVSTDIEKLNEIWRTDIKTRNEINEEWIRKTIKASAMIYNFGTLNFEKWIEDKINNATKAHK
ncbi:MAG: hypothetical protein DRJ05_00330 [Bacteroidetes bacterium]|nr:MAG: hypothetical protein DRJ05_00330 [Bacteroidota bacterium]